jgi:hypothetical protein
MYIFEVKDTFDERDMMYIWQNIAPKNTMYLKNHSFEISHPINNREMLNCELPKDVRFKVIKVKKKAYTSYQQVEDLKFGTNLHKEERSYNWPHDFYSLVELGKVDVCLTYGENV